MRRPTKNLIILLLCIFRAYPVWAEDDLRTKELDYLRPVLTQDLLPYAKLEIPALDQIKQVTTATETYLGLRVYDSQPRKNKGIRAELSVDYPYKAGDTVEYSWRFMLPEDFPADAACPHFWEKDCAPQNRWWVMGQWHDQPDRTQGETWDGYPGHSPPVAFGYGMVNGHDMLSLSYGAPDQRTVALMPIERSQWQSLRVRIHWSTDPDGWVSVTLNDAKLPAIQATGPNMHNTFQHYLKLGMYRHPDIKGDAWIYLDDVRIKLIR